MNDWICISSLFVIPALVIGLLGLIPGTGLKW